MSEARRVDARYAEEFERFVAETSGKVAPARWAFREAAAVLAWFDPPSLQPLGEEFAGESALSWVLADSEQVLGEDNKPHWALQEAVRRRTLRRLGSRAAMKRALAANARRPQVASQRAFEALVHEEPIPSDVPETAILDAVELLDGILDGLPSVNELRRHAGLARLLRPLHFLVGNNFQGREGILERLRDHVGVLPADEAASDSLESVVRHSVRFARRLRSSLREWPPLFICGPGGVGKSTVIAKFVLDHAAVDEENRFPFVFLNFDRAGLVAEEPLTLLREAVREIAIQYPHAQAHADALRTSITESMGAGTGSLSEAAAVHRGPLIDDFGRLVAAAEPRERPLLLVLDTFEEVQYLGRDRVEIVWDFLEEMQRGVPQLCIVVAGRREPEGFTAEVVQLGPFDTTAATAFVNGLMKEVDEEPLAPEEMTTLLEGIGPVPLSLKLAVGLLIKDRKEGLASLAGVDTHHKLFGFRVLRAKAASIQGQLYGRILEHIHDEEVQKIAYPGLVLRRVTSEIIREVLAEACKVEVRDDDHARALYDKLAREATLVEEKDGALEHRTDVRRLMLADLRNQFPKQTREIHERAVLYYSSRVPEAEVRERAEEIYHLLSLDRPRKEIEVRWLEGVEPYLKSALEELEPSPRRYLARRLGVTPDKKLQADADQQEWEKIASAAAERLLAVQDPKAALKELRRRPKRLDASPIHALQAEALRLLGRRTEALDVARRGIEAAARVGNLLQSAELEMISSRVQEAEGDLEPALAAVQRARGLAASGRQEMLELRAMVSEHRLRRKRRQALAEAKKMRGRARRKGRRPAMAASQGRKTQAQIRQEVAEREADREFEALRAEILGRTDRLTQRDLRRQPVLLSELAAEIGEERPELFRQSLRYADIGGPGGEETRAIQVAEILADLDASQEGDDVARTAGIDRELERLEAWRRWVEARGTRVGKGIAELLEQVEISQEGTDSLRRKLQESVDYSISKTVR